MTRPLAESCVTGHIPAGSGDGLQSLRHVLGGFVLAIGELCQSLLYLGLDAHLSRVRKNAGLRNGVIEARQELPGARGRLHLLHSPWHSEWHANRPSGPILAPDEDD